jgi:hypothetical protein
MDQQTQARVSKIERNTLIACSIIILLLLGIFPSLACIWKRYPGLYEWWTDGRAQLTVDCPESNPFPDSEVVSHGFGVLSHHIALLVVPVWNVISFSPVGRGLIVVVAGGLLVSALWACISGWLKKPISG